MKKIIIYSPCDGNIQEIEKLNDGVFSTKALGDGFYIEPKTFDIKSIFEKSVITQIFHTKHAFYIKSDEGPIALIHMGLNTVKLDGKPFSFMVGENESVDINKSIVKINVIDNENIDFVTPIVFDSTENKDYKFVIEKTGEVKQGEQIGYMYFDVEEVVNYEKQIVSNKNQFENIALEINKYVGTSNNYNNFYNCMTRLRMDIVDKSLVDLEAIKKVNKVKGVIWNGQELQIIFGGVVVKVKDELSKIQSSKTEKSFGKNKKNFKEIVFGFISGVMVPVIPVLMAAGLMTAIRAILIQSNVIEDVKLSYGSNPKYLTDYSIASGVVYILCQTGLSIVGIYFCYSTIVYLKGNGVMGIFIGLTLSSHFLFNGMSWELFTIGTFSVKLQAYNSSVLPMIIAGFIYFYLDKWVKNWMPAAVDIVFRHLLVYAVTVLAIFFVMGPIFGLIEIGVYKIIEYFGYIPYGIGTALLGFLWQILVLTGVHTVIGNIVILATNATGNDSGLYLTMAFAVMGQVGAAIGVAIRSKNNKVRNLAISSIPAGLFGITEPIIYSVNLPKGKPFIYGCIGGAVGGLIRGFFSLNASAVGGAGLLRVTAVIDSGWLSAVEYLIICFISIAASMILVILFYEERINEKKETFSLIRKLQSLFKSTKKDYKNDLISLKSNLEKVLSKENLTRIKSFESVYIKSLNMEQNQELIHKKINLLEEKRIVMIKKIKEKVKIEKINIVIQKYKNKLEDLTKALQLNKSTIKESRKWLESLQDQYMLLIEDFIKSVNNLDISIFKNNFYNVIHSFDISYELSAKQDVTYNYKVKRGLIKNEKKQLSI
ncbi:PTS system, sucrose-specific IIBC component [Spiroplasma helicoides]|uniref:PTS system, sucrose-specific IIBC component n=1 Tax=Spiroplasma helicoides TaxID=216938 RepID=A0A1B3SLV6_9MOLU|nr:PTS glucose transporter subunit IIA [Spiroplasma helicoides]AOG60921.1 PTS system, sucrose-specific IIBC component [Spiroplasma helicoides]